MQLQHEILAQAEESNEAIIKSSPNFTEQEMTKSKKSKRSDPKGKNIIIKNRQLAILLLSRKVKLVTR
jgi:hypothetical protein